MELPELLCALARNPNLEAENLRRTAAALGGLDALARTSSRERLAAGFADEAERALRAVAPELIASDLAWLQRRGITLLPCTSAAFPPLLAQIADPPPLLHVRGRIEALAEPQLAMVGSRHPTAQGRRIARDFAFWFAERGLGITSGLALGIDAASHEGALTARGLTVAVCGTGLDVNYPQANAELAERIVAGGGALVSEFPPGTRAEPRNFPRRNRLISGLSAGVLVVEAARDSGSLITARRAAEQGREVFAVPGSIHSPTSRGCHLLIRQGARLVEEAAEVLADLKIVLQSQLLASDSGGSGAAVAAPARLDKDYEILLDAVGFTPSGIDELVESTGLSSESVASMLLILELEGRVESGPGARYSRVRERDFPQRSSERSSERSNV